MKRNNRNLAVLAMTMGVLFFASCNNTINQTEPLDSIDTRQTDEKALLSQQQEEIPELTYADVAGIYDDEEQESRWSLMEDGTATWCMIGSLHYTEFAYTVKGNNICITSVDVDSEEDCYEYDPVKRTLKNEQGAVYYREDID